MKYTIVLVLNFLAWCAIGVILSKWLGKPGDPCDTNVQEINKVYTSLKEISDTIFVGGETYIFEYSVYKKK